MAGRAKKKCLFEDDVRAMLGMPKVAPTAPLSRLGRSPSSAPSHAQPQFGRASPFVVERRTFVRC
jgi:hypothetical protein